MKILIVSATHFEIKKLMERNDLVEVIPNHLYRFSMVPLQVDLLNTGMGMLQTAFYLGKTMQERSYDFALNAGICGAYHPEIPLGSVLHITEEGLPEPGVEEEGAFRSIFELGLMHSDAFPFEGGKLTNTLVSEWEAINRLPKVTGNSVNTMQTDPGKIKRLTTLFPADVETMEGAAFLFGCLVEKIPCAQIRAVSNYVGERDKTKWEVRLALKNLDTVLMEVLEEIIDSGS